MTVRIALFLVATVTIFQHLTKADTTLTQVANPDPKLPMFKCNAGTSETKVDITLTKGDLTSDIINVTMVQENSTCTVKKIGEGIVLKDCTLGQQIIIDILHKPPQAKIQTEEDISRFTLRCTKSTNDDKSYPVVVKSKSLNIINPTPTPIDLSEHSIPMVTSEHLTETAFDMSISPKDSVFLGQDITVDITSKVNLNVFFKVKSCEASDENDILSLPLWDEVDGCNSPKSDLFTGKWTQETKKVSHHVEAFRFDGGNKVVISCTLTICPNTKGCTQKCTGTKRKRRSASSDSSSETRTVSASFSVAERAVNAAKGDTETPMYRWMFLMLYSVVVFGIL